jgi:hypothetical protein
MAKPWASETEGLVIDELLKHPTFAISAVERLNSTLFAHSAFAQGTPLPAP